MRYTTIIDITEFPALYRNQAIRLVYLHLCLRSGYHDYDRDLCTLSIRRIALDTGLSVGAVRHALAQLDKVQLIERRGMLIKVRKFLIEQPISKRGKTKKEVAAQQQQAERRAQERTAAAERQQRQQAVDNYYQLGKTPFMVYYEEMFAKAKQGNADAATFCAQNESTYKMHQQSILKQQQK